MQAPRSRYRRTPLPSAARLKVGWIIFWFAILGVSPFIGFAIHGRVEEPGLVSQTIGEHFVPWSDVKAWEVHTDSDGPDFHLLRLHGKGHVLVRRFKPAEGTEDDLLDAVRSVGQLPIRLLCDIDDP